MESKPLWREQPARVEDNFRIRPNHIPVMNAENYQEFLKEGIPFDFLRATRSVHWLSGVPCHNMYVPSPSECFIKPPLMKLTITFDEKFARVFHEDFILEARFKYREFRGRHFFEWTQISFLLLPDSKKFMSLGRKGLVSPGEGFLFQKNEIKTEEIAAILDDLYISYEDWPTVKIELTMNAILNTVRVQLHLVENPPICKDCGRMHSDVDRKFLTCPFCSVLFQE